MSDGDRGDASLPRRVKRQRGDTLPGSASSVRRVASKQKKQPPPSESMYLSSKSHLVSTAFDCDTVIRRCWVAEGDGGPDPALFSSEHAVAMLLRTYYAYFKNLENPNDISFKPTPVLYPFVELEYPNTRSSERFILLAPKNEDHYNPIMDLLRTLYTIIECYLTPAQQALFGPIPQDILFRSDLFPVPPPSSPVLTLFLKLASVAHAFEQRDGPSFLTTFKHINALLRRLKYPPLPQNSDPFRNLPPNELKEFVHSWTDARMPKKVLMRIIEETYQRSVGPHVEKLKQYEAFSNAVYGELMPSFVYEILTLTGLTEDSLFLDLGSGVGNVVVQASLQTGCRSYGIELKPEPAGIAQRMVTNFQARCQMWGVKVGEIELEEGDMLQSARVNELIAVADVVLVDNKAFEPILNEQLKPKFLELKEGAYVVSLLPFVHSLNPRITERNKCTQVDDVSAIFDVTKRTYHSGSISWGNNGGTYYIHRVNRKEYASFRERFESSPGRRRRS
ncbi:Histone-lysine N-methyltransferase, H3 lysine-79 specific [Mycena sanguinolenta]|uniref:Histone-lysine N-methyltransferase, H3 lysine-79 specific n=1 Tax=Mycena sanguinolenta TaxID=230812 RepID=A0A8H6X875_9AGAR|nr:Histone-lysine N-methyltransferase, H3 lysine-79 specific [Mycena sanguinolenta]